jgi:hypothetical protein
MQLPNVLRTSTFVVNQPGPKYQTLPSYLVPLTSYLPVNLYVSNVLRTSTFVLDQPDPKCQTATLLPASDSLSLPI